MTVDDNLQVGEVETGTRLGYRPALDGLRAIAIGLVLLDHIHPSLFKGGQVGVSIFFPLSGFLITTLILEEMGRRGGDGFGFRHFWIRRSLRLFPALYAMLLVGLLLMPLLHHLRPVDVGHQLRWFARSALYVSNLGGAGESVRLGHTWTLGVEEQFYLVWPPLLVLGIRRGRRGALLGVLGAYITWGAVAGWLGKGGVQGVVGPYNATLALGCLVALLRSDFIGPGPAAAVKRYVPPLGWAGLAVIGAALLLGGDHPLGETDFRKWFVLLSGFAGIATVVSVVQRADGLLARLLSLPLMVHIGKLSYGLYVWHGLTYWVVSSFEVPGIAGPGVKLVLTYVVSWMSYRWIEQPALRLKARYT